MQGRAMMVANQAQNCREMLLSWPPTTDPSCRHKSRVTSLP